MAYNINKSNGMPTVSEHEWGSDHLPTMILINETPHEEEGQAQRYNLKKADWMKYMETCKLKTAHRLMRTCCRLD